MINIRIFCGEVKTLKDLLAGGKEKKRLSVPKNERIPNRIMYVQFGQYLIRIRENILFFALRNPSPFRIDGLV